MKKYRLTFILFVVIILSTLAACGNEGVGDDRDDGRIVAYTSFYPMYDFTSKIRGDKIKVYNMVTAGIDPHDWEPKASDIVNLEKADIFIYNGAGMEHWVEDILASICNEDLVVVEASKGIDLLDKKDHDHYDGHDHGQYDPHVWLNPQNAKLEMKNIMDALVALDPANKEYYEENFNTYSQELDILHGEFLNTIEPLPNRDIVVSHMAFSYLCHAYGLNQVAIEGLSSHSEPNPGRMAKIIDFIRENDIRVVFFEELSSPKIAETIAQATGARVDVLHPLEGLRTEEIEKGEDYFSIMRKNLEALKRALE